MKHFIALIILFTIGIGCQNKDTANSPSSMTAMTKLQGLSGLLNKSQLMEPLLLDSAMLQLNMLSTEIPSNRIISLAYRDLGWRNIDQQRYGVALVAFDKSLYHARKASEEEEEIETSLAMGRLFARFNDYTRAQQYYSNAENLSLKHENLKTRLVTFHEIAKNELSFKNLNAAERKAMEGLKMSTNAFPKEKVNLLNVLGLSLTRQGNFTAAEKAFLEAIELDKTRTASISGFLYGNLAACYQQQKRYTEAVQLLKQDLEFSITDRAHSSAYGAALTLAEVLLETNQYEAALHYFQLADSVRIAQRLEDNSVEGPRILLSITKGLKNNQLQLAALEKYTLAQEGWVALKEKENKEQITALISINEALNTIQLLQAEKEQSKQYNLLLLVLLLALLLSAGLASYIIITRNRRLTQDKQVAALLLQSKNQEVTLLQQARELQQNQIQLQEIEAIRREQEMALLRSRNEHQALAKDYYIDLKKKMIDTLLNTLQKSELRAEKYYNQIEKALLEVNLLESNPFIDSVNSSEEGPEFVNKLSKLYPELTSEELKLCTYLKLNMSTKEIAQIKSITIAGVNKSRNRIRRKFGLKPEQNLFDFLNQIG